jgi:hypothetical protein
VPRTEAVLLALILIVSPALAQSNPTYELLEPEAVFTYGFTSVAGIRELSDGRVILLDVGGENLVVIDSTWNTMGHIGREGGGPGEYRNPTKLFALPGDSSAALDEYFQRMLVITPDATPGDFISPVGLAGVAHADYATVRTASTGVWLCDPDATDGRGYYYSLGLPIALDAAGELVLVDSAPVERWDSHSPTRDTVAFIPQEFPPGCRPLFSTVVCPVPRNEPIRAFRTTAQWAAGPDGRVAVVTPDPYHVTFFAFDGQVTVGPEIQYERIGVSTAHKEQWREQRQRRGLMLVVDEDGQSYTAPAPSNPSRRRIDWPDYLPPFLTSAVWFASNGILWVERTTNAGEPPSFDMIDDSAQVVARIALPSSRRLVGFGRGVLYLVRIDEVDLEYLERYRLPAIERP